jgi:protein-tyrosine phosphatase
VGAPFRSACQRHPVGPPRLLYAPDVTKPVKIALGIGVATVCCAVLAVVTSGVFRVAWTWTTLACAVAAAAYVANRPAWLGKRAGRQTARALVVGPYLAAFRIACGLMRRWRGGDVPTQVAPGIWVAGRVDADTLPPDVAYVVDLVAEYAAPRALRALPGYRALPVLDGATPPDPGTVLDLLRELAETPGGVLVHCDSGRGRAPTFAAALLVVRDLAPDVDQALRAIRARRPVSAPTRVDRAFLAALAPALRAIQRRRGRVELESHIG